MKRSPIPLCLKIALALILLASTLSLRAATSVTWKNVAISGSQCWVTGVVVHPSKPGLVYVRTDVGGCYRWDGARARWIPLTDWLTFDQRAYFSVESIALDPHDPNVVYIACGAYHYQGNGAIFRSGDQGKTWKQLPFGVPMGGNEDRRWGGERLAVSPDGQTVLFGSRTAGLWRSGDAGRTWGSVAAVGLPSTANVCATAFDPKSPGLAYAAIYGDGGGVSVSHDFGATWAALPDSPQSPMRLTVAPDQTVWVTHDAGVSAWSGSQWSSANPGNAANPQCIALAVNPKNPNDVLVSNGTPGLCETLNHGTSWTHLDVTRGLTVPWFTLSGATEKFNDVSALAFDPFHVGTVWAGDWTGISRCDGIGSAHPVFTQQEAGHEQLVAMALAAPPTGPELFSGFLDADGFAHAQGLDTYPAHAMGGAAPGHWFGNTLSIAYQEGDPRRMARIGTQNFNGDSGTLALSSDAGQTWHPSPTPFPNQSPDFPHPLLPLRVAVSSNDPDRMLVMGAQHVSTSPDQWVPSANPVPHPWLFTADGGQTWNPCAGDLPSAPNSYSVYYEDSPIAADPADGHTFYACVGSNGGKFYRATDAVMTFQCANSASLLPDLRWVVLKVRPGVTGDLWVCLDNDPTNGVYPRDPAREGLYHSPDGGAHWTKIPSLTRCYNVCFGKAAPGSALPAMYAYGQTAGNGTDRVLQSLDLGKTWADFSDPANPLGNIPTVMEGSRQTYGRVFVGTGGRGVFYSRP